MAVPWLQIVRLVPSIVDVSRELLRHTKRAPPGPAGSAPDEGRDLHARIAALEENERRQAELVNQMAEQLAVLTRAVTSLHKRTVWLAIGMGLAVIVALVALALALR